MSYKFDTSIFILNKIASGERVTVSSLMDDLELSERSVYRYIRTLQDANFPITFNRGKNSYVFPKEYRLIKPELSLEENLALSLSKRLTKNFGEGIENALSKIENKLSVKNPEVPRHIIVSAEEIPGNIGNNLGIIDRAIRNFQRIEFAYKTLSYDEETTRKVDPYYLFYQDGFWHLRGYCHMREELRTFALDRIKSLKTLDEHFLPKNISPDEEISGMFGTVVDGEPTEVVLKFDRDIKPYVLRRKWHHSQKVKELKDGRLEMRFNVNGIEGIKQWIYRWLPYVEVVAPKELVKAFKQDLKTAIKKHTR